MPARVVAGKPVQRVELRLGGDVLRQRLLERRSRGAVINPRVPVVAWLLAALQPVLRLALGDLAFVGTVELMPQAKVVPVVRGEFNSKSPGITPWVIDAGVRVSPLESIRVTFTGRAIRDQWWGFVSLNLVDVADNEGWRF